MFSETISRFGGMKVTTSQHAYEMVPIFPDKHRTKRRTLRTRGKFGRTDRMNPLAYQTPFGIVCHPKIYAELKAMRNAPHDR